MDNIKNEIETVGKNLANPEEETRKEARRRQPWMPIIGSFLAGFILLTLIAFVNGWV